jgi:thiamine-monophosphate kinase
MKELDAITTLASVLPRAPAQLNRLFESDAELVRLGGGVYGFTIDEHSPDEDYFSHYFPETLGFNLVTCTVSDLLAAGVRPDFYLHSMTLPENAPDAFCRGLFDGIREGLEKAGCTLLGGDTSFAATWRYVGMAFGRSERPLLRSGAVPGDRIYSTGRFGSGNRQALLMLLLQSGAIADSPEARVIASPRFDCRLGQATLAWQHARFAIDSSDGYLGSVACLAQANPDVGFVARVGEHLVDDASAEVARRAGLLPETMLFGSAGEYELLFGVPAREASAFERAVGSAGACPLLVGEVTVERGIVVETARGRSALAIDRLPDPRALGSSAYIERVAALTQEILGGAGVTGG